MAQTLLGSGCPLANLTSSENALLKASQSHHRTHGVINAPALYPRLNHIEGHPAARVAVVGMHLPPDNQRYPTRPFPCAERHAALQPMWQPGASQCRHRRSGRRSIATTAAAEVQQGGRKEAGPMVSRSRQLSALTFLALAAAGACEQLRTTAAMRHSFRPHIECAMCTTDSIACAAPGGTGAVSSSICRL